MSRAIRSTSVSPARFRRSGLLMMVALAIGLGPSAYAVQDRLPEPQTQPSHQTTSTVRIGLATDLEHVALCCAAGVQVLLGGETLSLASGIRVQPGAGLAGRASYRLQVAALKDEQQAQGIADYLIRQTRETADVVFDAKQDLYRVRFGRFPRREDADAAKRRLDTLGINGAWVVSEGGELEAPELIIEQGGRRHRHPGRWLRIAAPVDLGIPFQRGFYRTSLLLFVNDRGLLNVINELSVEDYLRGVVPREMGPELYNEPEALKAQTVAARTFTLRNLGEFRAEGYDLCSTPRCQVYSGMGHEHHRSDRAIRDTAGQVLVVGQEPAEIFYTATCGGHTENVEVVFPLKKGAHLRGVPCVEAGTTRWIGTRTTDRDFPGALTRILLPPTPGPPVQVLASRLEHLALLANQGVARDQLTALTRGEVRRYLASVLDMTLDPRLLRNATELARLNTEPPPSWSGQERRFAAFVHDSGLISPPINHPLDRLAIERLLYELALCLGVLERLDATFLGIDGNSVVVRHGGKRTTVDRRPEKLLTYHRRGDALVNGHLDLQPGDPLAVLLHRGKPMAILQPLESQPVQFGQRNSKGRWHITRTPAQLRASVQTRYPGFPFRDFQVLSRGSSGRIGRMRLLGDGGETLLVEGLAVRWTLDLPDTWFDVERQPDGTMIFDGHGWGHGVGLCQAGAFGMARRGASYREILDHYYTGATLGIMNPATRASVGGSNSAIPR